MSPVREIVVYIHGVADYARGASHDADYDALAEGIRQARMHPYGGCFEFLRISGDKSTQHPRLWPASILTRYRLKPTAA